MTREHVRYVYTKREKKKSYVSKKRLLEMTQENNGASKGCGRVIGYEMCAGNVHEKNREEKPDVHSCGDLTGRILKMLTDDTMVCSNEYEELAWVGLGNESSK